MPSFEVDYSGKLQLEGSRKSLVTGTISLSSVVCCHCGAAVVMTGLRVTRELAFSQELLLTRVLRPGNVAEMLLE